VTKSLNKLRKESIDRFLGLLFTLWAKNHDPVVGASQDKLLKVILGTTGTTRLPFDLHYKLRSDKTVFLIIQPAQVVEPFASVCVFAPVGAHFVFSVTTQSGHGFFYPARPSFAIQSFCIVADSFKCIDNFGFRLVGFCSDVRCESLCMAGF